MPLADRLAVYRQMLTITIPQAAELIGASPAKAYDLARRGKLPITEAFGKRMVSVPRLTDMMQENQSSQDS